MCGLRSHHEDEQGVEVQICFFLNVVLDGGE